MRIIKFRVWHGGKMHGNEEALRILYNNASASKIMHRKDAVVMQFVGLHDKHGKEIYESDILQDGHIMMSVEFERGEYILKGNNCTNGQSLSSFSKHTEVIGNLHEHGHLLSK